MVNLGSQVVGFAVTRMIGNEFNPQLLVPMLETVPKIGTYLSHLPPDQVASRAATIAAFFGISNYAGMELGDLPSNITIGMAIAGIVDCMVKSGVNNGGSFISLYGYNAAELF